MANAHLDRRNSYGNAQDNRLVHAADFAAVARSDRPIDERDADAARLLLELHEARTLRTPRQSSESSAFLASICAEQEERALRRYRGLRNRGDSDDSQRSANTRTRSLNSPFGSDGNQYNPYAPYTSEEYMLQEIEAGRMDPGMMNMPPRLPNSAQSPLLGNGSAPPLAQVDADRHPSLMAPGHRPPYRQSSNDHGPLRDVPCPPKRSWFPHPYAGSTTIEGLSEEEEYTALPPDLEAREPQSSSNSPFLSLRPFLPDLASTVGDLGPVTSSRERPTLNESLMLGAPRQPHSASTGRERKRLVQPSLVVKLKIPLSQQSLQAPVPPRRGRLEAPSSSEASSAAQVTQNAHPLTSRSQGSVGLSLANVKTRAGWDPQAVRRLTRRAEAIQSPQPKRRRDAVSPQDISAEGTTPPVAGLPQAPVDHSRRATTGTSEAQQRSSLRAEAPEFVPVSAATRGPTPEDMVSLEAMRQLLDHHVDDRANYVPSPPRPSSFLPQLRYVGTRRLVFTSELLPRSFSAQKRRAIIDIFRTKAPYVPACISQTAGMPNMQYHVSGDKPPVAGMPYHAPHGPNRLGWPKDGLPLEVFHNIAGYLSRDDLLRMRMVNRECERKTSNIVFHTVVVPFRPEIYGMMIHDDPTLDTEIDIKGKGKAKETSEPDKQVATLHDGMKVFQAWGPHIKKFAMAFDVEEDQLVNPPFKGKFESFSEFWGKYKWPHPYYSRFEFCAGLEKKADEFRCMSAALSNLRGVRELGVSIDSGLGYLCGPDISDHAQLFQEKPMIFGVSETQKSLKLLERQALWDDIVRSLGPAAATNYVIQGDTILANQSQLTRNEWDYVEAHFHIAANPRLDPWSIGNSRTRSSRTRIIDPYRVSSVARPLVFQGINLANAPHATGMTEASPFGEVYTHDQPVLPGREKSPFHTAALVPNNLTPAQKEWLLEIEWAQRAFLSSYCMALTDNSHTFQHVKSFTVAKLSSRYLSALQREDFWGALPNLNTLTINVSADWRNILKLDSGIVEASDISPSLAATQFHKLLTTFIAAVPGIKTLNLGYFGGGEQQVGIFGRNRHILPAPLTDFSNHSAATSINANILLLPHVEHLTLTNCWITPPALKTFAAKMRAAKLRTLTLESVSLTAHSGVVDIMEPNPLEIDVLRFPDGPPRRFFDPAVGDLFQQRGSTPDPRSDGLGWMVESRRIGSWGNVIDAITPGPTISLLRYAYQHIHNVPEMRDPGSLERINFISCGYVKLVNMKDFNQSILGDVINSTPQCLRKRANDLMPIMMRNDDDPLLGQIIPTLHDHDLEVLQTAFPMEMGWDDQRKWDSLEDGQPGGGSGRFSGHVRRLIFSPECGSHSSVLCSTPGRYAPSTATRFVR